MNSTHSQQTSAQRGAASLPLATGSAMTLMRGTPDEIANDLSAIDAQMAELRAELEIRTRQRDRWQAERHRLRTEYHELLTMLSEVGGAPIPKDAPEDWDFSTMLAWLRSFSPNAGGVPRPESAPTPKHQTNKSP